MNTILFDLDGTLIDSYEGIIKCVLYTLDFYGIKEPDTAKLYRFIGPPLSESFERYYGFSHEKRAVFSCFFVMNHCPSFLNFLCKHQPQFFQNPLFL